MHFVLDVKANLIVGRHTERAKADEQRALYLHNLANLAAAGGLPGHMLNASGDNVRTEDDVVVASVATKRELAR